MKLYLIVGSVVLALALCCLRGAIVRRRCSTTRPPDALVALGCCCCIGLRIDRWYHRSWFHKAPWSLSPSIVCCLFYALGYWHDLAEARRSGLYQPYAKGCGRDSISLAISSFSPCCAIISWLRTTPLRTVLPLGGDLVPPPIGVDSGRWCGHPLPLPGLRVERKARRGVDRARAGVWQPGISGYLILICMMLMMSTALGARARFKTRRSAPSPALRACTSCGRWC